MSKKPYRIKNGLIVDGNILPNPSLSTLEDVNLVTGSLEDGQGLSYDAESEKWISTDPLLGQKNFEYTTENLSPGEIEDFSISEANLFHLLSVTSSHPVWIRFYGTEAARIADTRTAPEKETQYVNSEFYAEVLTVLPSQTTRPSPIPMIQGSEGNIFVRIVNTDTLSREIKIILQGLVYNSVEASQPPIDPDIEDPTEEPKDEKEPPEDPGDIEGEPDVSIVQPFDTLESTNAAGWIGNGNEDGGNDYNWKNSNVVSGATGCMGGVIARSTNIAYFADTSISELSRFNTFRMAGQFRLENDNFDGIFYLGYFNPDVLEPGVFLANFIGLSFGEPATNPTDPFRVRAVVTGEGGAQSPEILVPQNETLTFDLIWIGQDDGSGKFEGFIAGQSVRLEVGPGSNTYEGFGLLSGGLGNSNINVKTGDCLFDNIRYRKALETDTTDPEPPPPEEFTPEPEISVVQSFDTLENTTRIGWVGSGNESNGNLFKWTNSSAVTGNAGAIGGVLARSEPVVYFADTVLQELTRVNTIRLAGSFRLANDNFDGQFFLGYFNTNALTPEDFNTNFLGLRFREPVGSPTNPFRGDALVAGVGGAESITISLAQNTTHSFDLLWTPNSTSGSGVLEGTLAGQEIIVEVEAGFNSYNAFGILCGALGTNSNEKTGQCLFDDLRYRKGTQSIPDPEDPTPPPDEDVTLPFPYDPNTIPLSQLTVPSQVFNAKTNFNAVGNGVADDSNAVEACINAARAAGNNAMAYFPRGTYRVTRTIDITGSDYQISGAGTFHTVIEGTDTVVNNVTTKLTPIFLITDPMNIRIGKMAVNHKTDQLRCVVRQVSSTPTQPSKIHYEDFRLQSYGTLFVNVSDNENYGFTGNNGMVFQASNLNSKSVVTASDLGIHQKGLSFDNCSAATILFNGQGGQGWGAFRLRGSQSPRTGFFGIISGYHCLRVEDNLSIVCDDQYIEQLRTATTSDNKRLACPFLVAKGSPLLPPGRITISSPRMDGAGESSGPKVTSTTIPYEEYIDVNNYRGDITHCLTKYNIATGGDPNKTAYKVVCRGTAPLNVLLMGNTYEQGEKKAVPVIQDIDGSGNVKSHMLSNWNPGKANDVAGNKRVPNITDSNTLALAAQALADFRKLARIDLLLNRNINSSYFPLPTAVEASTLPELPELDWTPRSDWLDVTNLPSNVNGGVSALGDGTGNDADAIEAACNEVRKLNSPWSTVYIPPGDYRITRTIHPSPNRSRTVLSFTGSITKNVLTVTAVNGTGKLGSGQRLGGTGILAGTTIISRVTGNGGIGTYRVSKSPDLTSRSLIAEVPEDNWLNICGHGKETRIFWDGPSGGRMFRNDSNPFSSFIGVVWDGMNKAAQGSIHDTSEWGRRGTKVRHIYEAYINFTSIGAGSVPNKPDQRHIESSVYKSCIFINNGTGLNIPQYNDYLIKVQNCKFYDNNIGIAINNGQAAIRYCRFFRSKTIDINMTGGAPTTSVRLCSSVGSGAFFQRSIPTTNQSRCRNYTIQDCYVSGWKNTSFAIRSGAPNPANSWDPMLIFDCTFVNGPSSNPPIKLEHPVQVLHSNNKWQINGQVKIGAELFTNTTYLQEIPFAGETTPPPEEPTVPPQPPITPTTPTTTSIVMWGDSMTKYLGADRIANEMDDGRRVISKGIGGQTSIEIGGRQGGVVTTCRISGEVIPSSGSVTVTNLYPTITRSNSAGVEVLIAGIRGLLKPISGGYSFTRSTTGTATPAAGVQIVTPITTDVVNGVTFDLNSYTAIFWAGRNGIGTSNETDVTIYQKMVAKMTSKEKRVLILPVFNGGYRTESNGDPAIPTPGTGAYTGLMNRNAAVAAALPQYWFDVRRLFIDGAEAWMQQKYPNQYASTWGEPFPERTQSGLGPDSSWDVANDVPPRALRSDLVHLNNLGNQFISELIAAELRRRGW